MEHEYGLIGGNIFHGELTPDQLFHMRPAPGYADFTTPDRRALPVLVGDPRRWRRDRHPGAAVHPAHPRRPAPARGCCDARRSGAAAVGEPLDAGAPIDPVDARRRARPDGDRLHAARPRPTATTPSSPGSARTSSPAAWVCAGRVGRARRAGCADGPSPSATTPCSLVRGDDGVLRGFFNVCRHRGHELLPCGPTERAPLDPLPVPRLALRPRRRAAVDAALRGARRLRPRRPRARPGRGRGVARLGRWSTSSGTAPPVDEFLAGLEAARRRRTSPSGSSSAATHRYELAANWKLIVENYQECFHCPTIHPELCGVSPPTSGENYDGHDGIWVGGWQDLHARRRDDVARPAPVGGGAAPRPRRAAPGAASTTSACCPNLLVSLHPDYVMTHRLEPLAPGRTAVECQWLFAPEAVGRRRLRPVVRGRLLGPHQPPGLGGVRGRAARRQLARLPAGPFAADEDAVAEFVRLVAARLPRRRLPDVVTESSGVGRHGSVTDLHCHDASSRTLD